MTPRLFLSLLLTLGAAQVAARACERCAGYAGDNLVLTGVRAWHRPEIASLEFAIVVKGRAGQTQPAPAGRLDGAPVLGYVIPTTLQSTDVGFSAAPGIVALALTSHPDFDDSPLWDENGDGVYDNDGLTWHAHWVVLVEDKRVPGGLSVREFKQGDPAVRLPPTSSGMPMFMDSPGFTVTARDDTLRVVVPVARVHGRTDFKFDAVTCYLQVNTSDMMMPMLGVMRTYSIASGNLSLPFTVEDSLPAAEPSSPPVALR